MEKQTSSLSRRLALWLPALIWYGVIFCFSAQTGEASTNTSAGVLESIFRVDMAATPFDLLLLFSFLVRKGAHMFIFFVLTGLLLLPLREHIPDRKKRHAAALGLCGLLAALDELHQFFVPGRTCKLSDVCIDLCGGACFLLFLWLAGKLINRTKEKTGTV